MPLFSTERMIGFPGPVLRIVALCWVLLAGVASVAVAEIALTADERAWLEQHPVVRVAPDPDFPPIEFFDADGVYRGIAADFLRLIEKQVPLRFEIVRLKNWSEAVRQAQSRDIDMFGAAVPTPQRLEYMRFARPYVKFPAVVLVRDSAAEFPLLSELKGKRVAVVANYADHEYMLRAHPQIPLEIMPDISSGLRQVSFGKVDAMILNLASASYYIQKDGISNLRVTQDTDFVFDLSFAARKDWPELVSILEKSLAAISPQDKKAIFERWISLRKQSWRLSPLQGISLVALLLSLGLVAILLWNRSLKRQVQDRTADLEEELRERTQAEKEKAELQQQVHRARKMEALGMLAGGVAHDLNNILAGSVGYSDLAIRKVPQDNQLTTYLNEIRDSGRRAAAVVADLLTISRDAAAGREIMNLNILICEHLGSPEQNALVRRFPQISFKTELAGDLLNLSCSETHLKKCLMNLLINAAEATEKGSVAIGTENRTLSANEAAQEGRAEAGEYVVLTITDSGPGIAADDIERIFEPFYTRKKFGRSGTGLGLAVVWNTVQEHQGFIRVLQPGRGTRFELFFPATSEPLAERDGSAAEEARLRGCGEHVLVIDDEAQIRRLAENLLRDLGYRVSTVASGEEAITFVRRQPVDLLVLDMLMESGINGYQTFREIKKINPRQKAVIASGFSVSADVKRTQKLGAGTYLKKPYTRQELGLAIRKELLG